MKKIINGIARFQREEYPRHRALFARLARNQDPEAVFVTCADSRVVPNLILQADPGDLFIIRNAGNIIPPAGVTDDGTIASIEYAVEVLGTRDIVVCGHSNCGAMNGILHPEKVQGMASVAKWVQHAHAAREAVEREFQGLDDETQLEVLVDYNVIVQVRNLLTHDFARKRVEAGELEVYGWTYDIRTGMIRGMDESGRHMIPLDFSAMGSPDEKKLLATLGQDEVFWSRI